jgi:DNA end-binding protein Ku
MARAIWKGSLSFGLVNVPVELHTATRSQRPRLRMLHRADSSPVEYQRICSKERKPVDWKDIVKGYEYAKGRFVILSNEDFEAAALKRSRTIDILDFVKDDEIDDRYFESCYYVTPADGAERSYSVLREALRKTGKAGIGRVMLRNVQHLAAISVVDRAIVLTVMRFADELIAAETLRLPASNVDARELKLAESLIDTLTTTWDPAKYRDDYHDQLMRVIAAKMKGKRIELPAPEKPQKADVVDLMTRLRESLAQTKKKTGRRKTRRTAA